MKFDTTNIDAQNWLDKFCEVSGYKDDGLLLGYFCNYRFAISDPSDNKYDVLKLENAKIKALLNMTVESIENWEERHKVTQSVITLTKTKEQILELLNGDTPTSNNKQKRDLLMRDICEMLPEDTNHELAVCVNYDHLYRIVSEHLCVDSTTEPDSTTEE